MIDQIIDFCDKGGDSLSRSDVKEIIYEMSRKRIKAKITLNINEFGEIVDPEVILKGDSAVKMFLEIK